MANEYQVYVEGAARVLRRNPNATVAQVAGALRVSRDNAAAYAAVAEAVEVALRSRALRAHAEAVQTAETARKLKLTEERRAQKYARRHPHSRAGGAA